MPAKDRYHDTVKRALIKDGWDIVAEQFFIKFYGRHLWIDIRVKQQTNQPGLLVEVKGFENVASQVDYLEAVLGQYVLYQAVLEELDINMPLYLAVPISPYEGFLSEHIAQVTFKKIGAKLLVFDPQAEEIITWLISK